MWVARQLLLGFVHHLDTLINSALAHEQRPSDAFLQWLSGDPANPAQATALRIAEAIDGWLGAIDIVETNPGPEPVTMTTAEA